MFGNSCWAIVLAGGEGTRIQPLIERCLGFACPKQYFTFCGERSMLEHTVERAVQLVGPDRVITVIGNGHGRYLENQKIQGLVVEQPNSRGTGAGVFLPATHIMARDPDATVLIFPSDHFVCPRAEFLAQVDRARFYADHLESSMILVAAVPDLPETDYGWIEPGGKLKAPKGRDNISIRKVKNFHEKPDAEDAARCFERGFFWNTMILASKLRGLWQLGKKFLPGVMERFESLHQAMRGRRSGRRQEEQSAVVKLYDSIPSIDFSNALLSKAAKHCAVMPLHDVFWSDWGRPERVFEGLRRIGREPTFLQISHGTRLRQSFSA